MVPSLAVSPCGVFPANAKKFRLAARSSKCSLKSHDLAIDGRNLSFSVATDKLRDAKKVVTPILTNCSIRVPVGQLWMLLGPNGCGKSTLLKVLAGLLTPSEGTLRIRKPKSFVFQNPDYQVVMPTVDVDVAFGLGNLNISTEEVKHRVEKALAAVGMSDYSQINCFLEASSNLKRRPKAESSDCWCFS